MKTISRMIATLVIAGLFTLPAQATTADRASAGSAVSCSTLDATGWSSFSQSVVKAVRSNHEGLRQGGLRMIIRYGHCLSVDSAAREVVAIYRNHPDEGMRQMAVAALGRMDSGWAHGLLERSIAYEQSPVVLRTIRSVVADMTN